MTDFVLLTKLPSVCKITAGPRPLATKIPDGPADFQAGPASFQSNYFFMPCKV